MARERRQFSEEFKREAVRLAYESGRRLTDVARELDVGPNLIRRWRLKFAGVAPGRAPTTEQQEIVRPPVRGATHFGSCPMRGAP